MSINLSPRLAAIAAVVPDGASLIDVGTDHAMLPVRLAQDGSIRHAWASDIRPGPLQGALALLKKTKSAGMIELRQTDGLNGFSCADGDTIVIAGMGGETMEAILAAAPWTKAGVLLVLEPQSKQAVLRRFLTASGYNIRRELLVADAGRIYPVLLAEGGQAAAYSEAELHTGLLCQIAADPLFPAYLDGLTARAANAAPYDPKARMLLAAFESMKERLFNP